MGDIFKEVCVSRDVKNHFPVSRASLVQGPQQLESCEQWSPGTVGTKRMRRLLASLRFTRVQEAT
jgi:hypothetical protein